MHKGLLVEAKIAVMEFYDSESLVVCIIKMAICCQASSAIGTKWLSVDETTGAA